MDEPFLLEAIEQQLLPRPPQKIGVAVSGGGDSVALLSLMAAFAKQHGTELHVISIDHGLRTGTQQEIKMVTELCATFGCEHHVEYWSGWDGGGNLQDRARSARYELIGDWAAGNGISVVMLGHTANDQAETFLMRLARGAGVDGLSAMAPRRISAGITWVRPLLNTQRRTLRDYLRARDLPWSDDPSNENRNFERIRMRDALRLLEPLGFSVENLIAVAAQMSQARTALNWQTFLAAKDVAFETHGAICINMKGFRALPGEIARRLLVHVLVWLSNSDYPPRRAAVRLAQEAIRQSAGFTLHGCQLEREGETLWIFREFNVVRDLTVEIGDIWDDRWYVDGPEDDPEYRVGALGHDGIAQVPEWRETGLPRAALLATPGVFMDGELIAAPVARADEEWTAELDGGADGFFASLLSH